jgi:phosphoglycolate phosphatase-like HAD superfamily hydrolase
MTDEKRAEAQLRWLGIDLDKTVAQNSSYPDFELLDPVDGAKDALTKLEADGWKIIIHTSRHWQDYELIESWLLKHQIPFRRIVCGKLFAKYYVDDRGIAYTGDWNEVLKQIK